MNLAITNYTDYECGLPQEKNHVVGQITGESIIVYQAFNHAISNYALEHQKFGGSNYSMTRMTWIKPNFLWMMYRSGWGTKPNQERTLAIKLKLDDFKYLLELGVYSGFKAHAYKNPAEWKSKLTSSEVRIQWDPDHNPFGARLGRKAVQIGLKGGILNEFNHDMIESIEDISEFVEEQRLKLNSDFANLLVLKEQKIELSTALNTKYDIAMKL